MIQAVDVLSDDKESIVKTSAVNVPDKISWRYQLPTYVNHQKEVDPA